jgi:hypothetical protein
MKPLKLFLTSLFLTCILAFLLPGSMAFAQSNHATQPTRPMSTIPYCYGDGLPHNNPPIQACDGQVVQNTTNCPRQFLIDSKVIGSVNQGVIGNLNIYFSGNTSQLPWGCNAWWATIHITHSGCYTVLYLQAVENNADTSGEGDSTDIPISECQGHTLTTRMVGDWQPGVCYYAASQVYAGAQQNTTTITSCY